MVNNDGILYLLAEEKGNLKTYTFSKIKNFQLKDTSKSFDPKKEFLEEIEKSNSNWFTNKIELILQIDNKAKDYFQRKKVLSNQKILDQNDSYMTISTSISFDDEILKIVKYW
ncbi:transcriptional regulator, partial [Malaciobacter halophilus]